MLVASGVAAYLLVGRFDLGRFAAGRASAALGRPVTIAGLHVTPGRWITVDLSDVQVANVTGGSRPGPRGRRDVRRCADARPGRDGGAGADHPGRAGPGSGPDRGGGQGRLSADVAVSSADIRRLRRALGFGPVPLLGQLDAEAVATSSGATLNAATHAAHVSAVVSMNSGSIAREVIEMASIDVRLLFRKPQGHESGILPSGAPDMRAGVGTVVPLRVRAANGAIAGAVRFDLYRRWFDLTTGSQSASTSVFALDIPVHVSGAFANPSVEPARWSVNRAGFAGGSNS